MIACALVKSESGTITVADTGIPGTPTLELASSTMCALMPADLSLLEIVRASPTELHVATSFIYLPNVEELTVFMAVSAIHRQRSTI